MSKSIPQFKFKVEPENSGIRLDLFLSRKLPQFTRTKIQKSITRGLCLVDGFQTRSSFKVKDDQTVSFSLIEESPQEVEAQSVPLAIVYENSSFLVIDKPAGMVVHPGAGNLSGTLLSAILGHLGKTRVERAGIVHRLDKETSGLIVVAKDEVAFQDLQHQFKDRIVTKKYLALTWGKLSEAEAKIDLPIARSRSNRKKMTVSEKGREAQTVYKLKKEYLVGREVVSLIEAFPKTGRTHQIRVHLSAIGHPVVGDKAYGYKRDLDKKLGRQFLHACSLKFRNPKNQDWVEFKAELPEELGNLLSELSL